MANLETLELTINANAESASQGLERLINSLTALSRKVGRTVGGLKQLNEQLSTLSGFSKIKLPSVMSTDATKNVRATTKAIKTQQKAIEDLKDYDWGNNRAVNKASSDAKPYDVWKAEYDARGAELKAQREAQAIRNAEMRKAWIDSHTIKDAGVRAVSEAEAAKILNGKSYGDYISGVNKGKIAPVAEETQRSTPFIERAKNAYKSFKDVIGQVVPKFHLLNRVMRIASTMLIRMGVRALFKGAKEGLDNYYQYAKATNNAFAQGMDSIASTWATLKNQMGAAIAPALSAALPVLNSLASAATTAFNALSQLLALLTGQSTWSKATNQVQSYGDAINKANGGGGGGGMKEMLANFDELNVIASEGGGGGGGAAAQTAEAFENMFEEIGEFDEKIRSLADFIKQTIGWIKENFDIILATAGLIGLAILGWRMSQNFEGALGQLGKYIAGGALIAVGIILEYDFGKKVGAALAGGKPLEWEDILEGIVGFVAAGLGGYMIGGGVGAAIGIGIAVVAFITGVMVGYSDQIDRNKWGKESLTPEQIKEFVKNRFSFDVEAEIKIADLHISNARAAKAHLDRAIWEFGESLRKIKLGVDTSDAAFEDVIAKFQAFKTKFDDWQKNNQELLTAYFQLLPYDPQTQQGIMSDVSGVSKELSEYFENIGKQMADLFDQGMRTGWKNNEKTQILALLDHVESITSQANQLYEKNKLESGTKSLLANFTRDTAEGILKEQRKQLEEHYTKLKAMNQEAADAILLQASYAEASGMTEEAERLKKDAQKLIDGFEGAYNLKLMSSKAVMKREWMDAIEEIYGEDIFKKFIDMAGQGGSKYINGLKESIHKGADASKEYIQEQFQIMLKRVSPIVAEAAELFGISGWELLEEREKKNFFDYTFRAVKMDAIPLLKSALNIPAGDMINVAGWDRFSSVQKLEFLTAMAKAYGSYETLNAAKNSGINVINELNQGIKSRNPEVAMAAKELMNTLKVTIDKNGHIVLPDVSTSASFFSRAMQTAKDKMAEMARIIKNSPLVSSAITVDQSTYKAESGINSVFKKLQSWVTGLTVTIPVTAQDNASGAYGVVASMASTLQSWASSYLRVAIPVGVYSDGSSVTTAVHDTNNGGKMVSLHNIPGAILEAEGGFPPMGSVFIAGEAGAELVGTINGRTGVANTDQIVTGIAEGVAAANSEQNALLRQQNELLRGILEKDASVRIGASAALGRVARQSLDMYGSLVGG